MTISDLSFVTAYPGFGDGLDMPPRSRLFSLEPIGIGTPMSEGLTSYIIRLAGAHSANPRRLIRTEYVAVRQDIARLNTLSFFRNNARTVNGLGSYAHIICSTTTILTGRRDLRSLTLQPLQHLLPNIGEGLLARRLKWCPECLNDMVKSGVEPYLPLIWSFSHYRYCGTHRSLMVEHCPSCHSLQPYIPCYPSNWHCSNCRCSLDRQKVGDPPSADDLWISRAIENVVQNLCALEASGTVENLIQYAKLAAIRNTSGKQRTFCNAIGLEQSALWNWTRGHQPTFPQWLRLSYALDTLPSHILLFSQSERQPMMVLRRLPDTLFPGRRRTERTNAERQKISEELLTIANSSTNLRSLSSIARRYNLDCAGLRRIAPEPCSRILEKFAMHRKRSGEQSKAKYRKKLLQVFDEIIGQGEYPGGQKLKRMLAAHRMVLIPKYLKKTYFDALSEWIKAGQPRKGYRSPAS